MENDVRDILLSTERREATDSKGRVCEESKKIWRVALPWIIARVTAFGTLVVTQSFIGHLSSVHLAGYSLVQSLTFSFVSAILIGMSSATETLCGQAYGAEQYHMMSIYLQRSWIVILLTLTILIPILIFGEAIFKLLGEEEQIALSAGYISWWFIPTVYSFVFIMTIQMYLQAQDKNIIIVWVHIAQFIIHVPLAWLFVYRLNWGIDGAMAALSLSSWFVAFVEFLYLCGGGCSETWTGFSTAAFKDLWPVIKLSISSGVMVCLEMWYNSVLVLLAGHMSNAEVAISAFSICLNINGWEFMICLGFLGAACVRIANELGRADAKATKLSVKVLVTTSVVVGVFFTILCLVFGNSIGYLFTNDVDVVKAISDLSLLLALAILLNSIYPVLSGVAVGAGFQGKVAIVSLCCIYLIGLPVGVLLGYLAHLQVKGIWVGILIGVLTQSLVLIYMIWKMDWDEQVQISKEHLQRWRVKSIDESNYNVGHA